MWVLGIRLRSLGMCCKCAHSWAISLCSLFLYKNMILLIVPEEIAGPASFQYLCSSLLPRPADAALSLINLMVRTGSGHHIPNPLFFPISLKFLPETHWACDISTHPQPFLLSLWHCILCHSYHCALVLLVTSSLITPRTHSAQGLCTGFAIFWEWLCLGSQRLAR